MFFKAQPLAFTPALYQKIIRQARQPSFYADYNVPDTIDGRFELIVLHVFLVLWALKQKRTPVDKGGQALFDYMIVDMDRSLRETGVGDLSVGRKIKAIAEAFYGRVNAYEAGLADPNPSVLEGSLRRNLFGTLSPDSIDDSSVRRIGLYTRQQAYHIQNYPADSLLCAQFDFILLDKLVCSLP